MRVGICLCRVGLLRPVRHPQHCGHRSGGWKGLVSAASSSSSAVTPRTLGCPTMRPLPNCANFHQFTVSVEGNIGCGKTTFLKHFDKSPDVYIVDEPVKKWRSVQGHNLLDLMYRDQSRWGCTFQSYVQLTMLQNHTTQTSHAVKMMERSIFSAKYCFVENLHRSGKLSGAEYSVLSEWFDWLTTSLNTNVDLIVYLRAKPEVVQKRIESRRRAEEAGIPIEYLRDLHQLHEDWLFHKTAFERPAPVLVLDADQEEALMPQEYKRCEEFIADVKKQIVV